MDKSRVEPTIFLIEKISFSLKLFFGHFYGQSFIKTVRGPLLFLYQNSFFWLSAMKFGFSAIVVCIGLVKKSTSNATFIIGKYHVPVLIVLFTSLY